MLFLLVSLAGCRSDCARLCETQARCSGASQQFDQRVETCNSVCDAFLHDPKRAEGMKAVIQCADRPCAELEACVKSASE